MNSPPLRGKRVVTTRDEPGELDRQLAGLGAEVLHVPLIAVAAPLDGGEALRRALATVDQFDWVVVTSRHGAAAVGSELTTHPEVRVAAVGTRTADVLAQLAGRAVDVVPHRQTAADLLAAMPDGDGQRLLLAQADRADPALADGLRRRGYDVRAVTAYRTELRTPTDAERAAALAADCVAFASGSACEAWATAIGTNTPPVVVAIGPVTAQTAHRLGLLVTHVASTHDLPGLVAAVQAALATP